MYAYNISRGFFIGMKNRPHRHERRRQRIANSYPSALPSARIGSGNSLAIVKGTYKAELGHRDHKNGIARTDYYNRHGATKTLQSVDSIREIESIPQTASEKALIKRLASIQNRVAENLPINPKYLKVTNRKFHKLHCKSACSCT